MKKPEPKKAEGKAIATPPQNRAVASPRSDVLSLESGARPDPTKRRPGSLSRSILGALVLFSAFSLQPSAFATVTVTGMVYQVTSAALDTKITFTPTEDVMLLANGLSAGPAKTISSTNGAFGSPLDPGRYLVRLPLVSGRNAFTIDVPVGTGSINITSIISAPWTYQQFVNTITNFATTNLVTVDENGRLNVSTQAVQQLVRDMSTLTNNRAAATSLGGALNVSGAVVGQSVTSANGVSAVTDITTSNGQFNGSAAGVSNVPPAGISAGTAGISITGNSSTATNAIIATNALFAVDTTFQLRATGLAPQPVIVFADWNSDAGEMHGARDRLARMDRGEIKILAYIVTLTNEYAAADLAHFLTKYGHPEIPVGICRTNFYAVQVNVTNSLFRALASGTPLALYNSNYPAATALVRNVLARQPDASVANDWEGDFAPLWELAQITTGDRYSELDGLGLLGRKTQYHFINAGDTNNFDFLVTVTGADSGDLLTHATLDNSITGQPVRIVGAGTAPGNVTKGTTYYLIKVSGTTSRLATTYSNAVNNVNITFTSDSSGALQIEDQLRDQEEGDYNLHMGPTFGPPLINYLTNMLIWNFVKNIYFPPTTTDPAQLLYVGQNVTNATVHPAHMPIYQDMTNYAYIFSVSPIKPPWDYIGSEFVANGTNAPDGTQMFDLSPAGKATVSAAFPGHIFWTNNPVNSGVGTSNHYYLTLHSGFQNQITNRANSYIDAPPFQNGADYRNGLPQPKTFRTRDVPVGSLKYCSGTASGSATGMTFYNQFDGSGIGSKSGVSGQLRVTPGSQDFTVVFSLAATVTQAVATVTLWAGTNDSYTVSCYDHPFVGTNSMVMGSTSNQSITNTLGRDYYYTVKWTNNWTSYYENRPKAMGAYFGANYTTSATGDRYIIAVEVAEKHSTDP